METHALNNQDLILFLEPEEPTERPSYEIELARFFRDILRRANDFVPSEAGTIFLRDATGSDDAELVVAAGFGDGARELVGARLPAGEGIAGFVLERGQTYVSATPSSDLLADPPSETPRAAGTVVALPLAVGAEVVGVLELLKERGGEPFEAAELETLEFFAQSISAAISHAVEAQRSKEMARRDDLTHLFNDRYLHHALSDILERALADQAAGDCGLVFLDLDEFKSVNDRFGHLVGSRVLREIGDILRQVLPGPAVPARYGGDEFVIILPEATKQEVVWVAETVRKTIETHAFLERPDPDDPINYPGLAIRGVTCSVGLASLRDDALPALGSRERDVLAVKNELIRIADARMYRAKEEGRNLTVSDDSEDRPTATG